MRRQLLVGGGAAVFVIGVAAVSVVLISGSRGGGGSRGAGGESLQGGITATCKPVWTTNSTGTNYPSFAAALAANKANAVSSGPMAGELSEMYEFPSITMTASATVDIGSVSIVYYDASGTETGSGQYYTNSVILTAGQSAAVDAQGTEADIGTEGPSAWASCEVVDYSS